MSPGVRTIPAPMELPMAAEMPNQTPRICSSLPRLRVAPAAAAMALVEGPSNVLDNVKSQGSTRNSAIIAAARQNASGKSAPHGIAACGFRSMLRSWHTAGCEIVVQRISRNERGRQGTWL